MLFKVWDGLAVRPGTISNMHVRREKIVVITLQDGNEFSRECIPHMQASAFFDEILNRLNKHLDENG